MVIAMLDNPTFALLRISRVDHCHQMDNTCHCMIFVKSEWPGATPQGAAPAVSNLDTPVRLVGAIFQQPANVVSPKK
jgi:hypothetical protein